MERDDATPSLVKAMTQSELVAISDKEKPETREKGKKRSYWKSVSLLVHLGLVAALIWAAQVVGTGINNIDKRLQAGADRTQQLTVQTAALKAEIDDLHQYLSSQANQDVLFLQIMVTKPELDRELARKIARLTSKYATIYRQDPDLVLAIIAIESNFNPKAVSSKGALGLMQVMPQWKTVLGITDDLTDPETSIRYGLQILGFYKQMYKEMDMALTAYNRGPGPVDMALMRGENPQNSYAPRVLKRYNLLKSMKVGKQ